MVKIKYIDKSPTSKADCTVTCADKQVYVDLTELNENNTSVDQYATCENMRTLLNGNFPDFPNVAPSGQVYVSNSLSGSTGEFDTPIVITRTFTQQHTAPGISFTFDKNDDKCFCNDLNVKWYRGDTLLYDVDFTPNDTTYFCQQNVIAFNKIVITFNSTNKGYRFLRIFNIDDGVDREFGEDEIDGLSIIEEISEPSDMLSINTADIKLNTKIDASFVFQRTQPIFVYLNDNLICKSFNSESTRGVDNKYNISANDYIGILDKEQFLGGLYSNYSLKALLDTVCGNVPHDYVGNETISGYLSVMTRREALQYVAFATGKVIDCSRSENIKVRTLSNTSTTINESRVIRGIEESTGPIVTKIILAQHTLKANAESTELINEVINGTYTYTFGEPHHSYSISGGTLVANGANYAIITGNGGTVVLTGNGYDDVVKLLVSTNPIAVVTDLPNVIEKTGNKLITSANSSTILSHIEGIYFRNKTLKATILLGNEKVGDLVIIPTENGNITGRITSMELDLINGLADLTILES